MSSRRTLAQTWNGNESGRLWLAEWFEQDGGYFSQSEWVYQPQRYKDEAAFWAAFEREAAEYNGKRLAVQ